MPVRKYPPDVTFVLPIAGKKKKISAPGKAGAKIKPAPSIKTPHDEIIDEARTDLAAWLEDEVLDCGAPKRGAAWKRKACGRKLSAAYNATGKKKPGA